MTTKGEIERKIAALQSQLAAVPTSPPSKKRKSDATVLAPGTPSPRKKKSVNRYRPLSPTPNARQARPQTKPVARSQRNGINLTSKPQGPSQPEPPSLLTQLKSMSETRKQENKEPIVRSEGFGYEPAPLPPGVATFPVRDDRLAIVEELTPGPAEHTPPADDPNFDKLEPNSGIRLRTRVMTHEALNDHLYGRFYLPPSLLYSIARLDASKQNYVIPVEGDWLTIAVVAERGDVKLTAGPGLSAGKDWRKDGDDDDGKKKGEKGRKQERNHFNDNDEGMRKGGKKFVNLKLIDLGVRSRTTGSSSDVPRGSLKGDAQLTLLLFEADHCDKIKSIENGKERVQKSWRGGSGGAFEECYARLKEGTVIALMNTNVLRPFQNSKNKISNTVLALSPSSVSSIVIIGYASDLGRCSVLRRDGKPCGSWVDRRISGRGSGSSARPGSDVCDYHIQAAVQKSRAGRSELSVATSGLSSSVRKDKSTYDPVRKIGLKPEGGSRGPSGESTYILGGFVATSSSASPASSMFVGEKMGKDAQERAHRKDKQKREEKSLMDMLGSKGSDDADVVGDFGEKFGGREALDAVRIAREMSQKGLKPTKSSKGKEKAVDIANENEEESKKKKYSAEMVKKLGFNPLAHSYSARSSQKKPDKAALSKLADLSNQKRDFRLGPPPGQKRRSCVIPVKDSEALPREEVNDNIGSDSDLEVEPPPAPSENMDFLHSDSEDDLSLV